MPRSTACVQCWRSCVCLRNPSTLLAEVAASCQPAVIFLASSIVSRAGEVSSQHDVTSGCAYTAAVDRGTLGERRTCPSCGCSSHSAGPGHTGAANREDSTLSCPGRNKTTKHRRSDHFSLLMSLPATSHDFIKYWHYPPSALNRKTQGMLELITAVLSKDLRGVEKEFSTTTVGGYSTN